MKKRRIFFDISERKLLLRSLDITVIIFSLTIASKYTDFDYIDINSNLVYGWFLLLALYYLLFGQVFYLYNLKVSSNGFLVIRSVLLTAIATSLFYIFSPFISPVLPSNRLDILYFFILITLPVIVWRFLYMQLLFSPKFFKPVLVIGNVKCIKRLIDLVDSKDYYKIVAYISDRKIEGDYDFIDYNNADLFKFINKSNPIEIVVCSSRSTKKIMKKINKQLIPLYEEGIEIKSFESFYEEIMNRIPREYLNHSFYEKINFRKNNENRFFLFLQRLIDVFISIIGLIVLVGLMPLILIGNIIANRGPIFYIQKRVGLEGKTFKIYKLRSMVKNAEKEGAVWAVKDDKRITPFGKLLRISRLDELPQVINIIKGDMGLIGPRPERPEFVEELEEKIPFYSIRHIIKPGLTGWAQVNYPYASTVDDQEIKLRYDLYYIKERDPFLDFKILIKTASTILHLKGQ